MKDSKQTKNDAVETTPAREIKMTGILISKEAFARDYRVLRANDEAKVIASSVSDEMPLLDGEGNHVEGTDGRLLYKHIINLKAVADTSVNEIRTLFQGREAVDLGELAPFVLSFNSIVPASGNANLPFKGQEVYVRTALYESKKNEGTHVLGIAQLDVPKVAKAKAFSFDSVLEDDEEIAMDE